LRKETEAIAAIDHIIWATPDLDACVKGFAQMTGVEPRIGGSHPGLGTRNALLSLGPKLYLEIIGPDPAQDLADTYGGVFAKLSAPGMFTLAARSEDLSSTRKTLAEVGLTSPAPFEMGRKLPNGDTLSWRIMAHAPRGAHGWEFPFFIDWGTVPAHPAEDSPKGCSIKRFAALAPDAVKLERAYRAVGLDIEVRRAMRPGFETVLDTPRGKVVLNPACGMPDYSVISRLLATMAQRTGLRA
jgi:hypothetical protein